MPSLNQSATMYLTQFYADFNSHKFNIAHVRVNPTQSHALITQGYSSSSTCEIGLINATNFNWQYCIFG